MVFLGLSINFNARAQTGANTRAWQWQATKSTQACIMHDQSKGAFQDMNYLKTMTV